MRARSRLYDPEGLDDERSEEVYLRMIRVIITDQRGPTR
jgi:hypothetical protein